MRFPSFLLLLACTLSLAFAQSTLGKSDAEILKMGLVGWNDYYAGKVGSSTADMSAANEIYGKAAARRNDKLLADQLDGDFKTKVLKLRNLLKAYDSASIDVEYAKSGGGTMYIPMWAAVTGSVEDALYFILTSTGPKAKPMVVSKVSKALDRAATDLEAMHRDKTTAVYFKYQDAKKALAKMRSSYSQIVAIAKTMNRKDSDRLLEFCLEHAPGD